MRRDPAEIYRRYKPKFQAHSAVVGRHWTWVAMNYFWCRVRYGVDWTEYRVSRMDRLNARTRRCFIGVLRHPWLRGHFNRPGTEHLTDNKVEFLRLLGPMAKRGFYDPSAGDAQSLRRFLDAHPRVLVKKVDDMQGHGIYVPDPSWTAEQLQERLLAESAYLEEMIVQHPALSAVCRSVNTIRIHTIVDGQGQVHMGHPYIRFGLGDSLVDNLHAGGQMYPIDMETGIICGRGFNQHWETRVMHPGLGRTLLGMQIPMWDKVLATADAGARMLAPMGVRYLAWDIAVTPDDTVIVEVNHQGNARLFEFFDEPRYNLRRFLAWK